MLTKILAFVKGVQYELFLIVCVALIAFTSYQLGLRSSHRKLPLTIEQNAAIFQAAQGKAGESLSLKNTPSAPRDPRVVVSKSSTSKKYHFTWCSSGQRIKEENKIWFANETLAQQAGYTLADNCQ